MDTAIQTIAARELLKIQSLINTLANSESSILENIRLDLILTHDAIKNNPTNVLKWLPSNN